MVRFRNPFHRQSPVVTRIPKSGEQDTTSFRRSRTLTGSASEQVKSVSENRAQLKSPRLKEHELRTHRKKLGGYLAAVAAIIVGIVILLSQYLGVVSPRILSSQPLQGNPDTQQYLATLNSYFWNHPLERFRFALNEQSLASYLETQLPEVESISFEQTGLALAAADIRLRVPVVTWQLQSKTYYVDGTGHAFTRNDYVSPTVTVKDNSGLPAAASGAIVSNRFLESMGRIIALCHQSGVVITGATLPRNTTREIDFNLEGRGYIVKAQLGRDPASQSADIVNAVKYIDSKGITPKYVDVRVVGRAAYQ